MKSTFRSIGCSIIAAGFLATAANSFAQTASSESATGAPASGPAGTNLELPVVVVPVHMTPKRIAQLAMIMRSNRNSCYLQDLQPDDDSSMIMICGVDQPVASLEP